MQDFAVGVGGVMGGLWGYFVTLEKSKISRFFKFGDFQKMFRKSMKNLQF